MKHKPFTFIIHISVTPCVGVWIETDIIDLYGMYCDVTPCVGVWIETKGIKKVIQK